DNGGTLTVTNSTLSNNSGGYTGGGINNYSGMLTVYDIILAGNSAATGPDLAGALTYEGRNLIGSSAGGSGFPGSDLLDVNPLLGPLQDNGGPTPTMALLPGSPAIDAGDNTNAPATDQRGYLRVVNGTIDIGAFEVQAPMSLPTYVVRNTNDSGPDSLH